MHVDLLGPESLTLMYLSDQTILDTEALALAAVGLANTDGGLIYLGIEPDGMITGLNPNRTDPKRIAADIADHTHPAVGVQLTPLVLQHKQVLEIEVPRSSRLVATGQGTIHHRRRTLQGTFVNTPLLPYDFASRGASTGLADVTAQPIAEASLDDLLDIERARIRQVAARCGGERLLQNLSNEELDRTLHLTANCEGRRVPTLTGLLLAGSEEAIVRHVPTHEVALIDPHSDAETAFIRTPILRLYDQIEQFYHAHATKSELHHGRHLVQLPSLAPEVFRECVINAIVHRDYARPGAIYIRWMVNSVTISSPGPFLSGVSVHKLLDTAPQTRNPLLAGALKRIGLATRTGRGMQRIYQGLLEYGRTLPSFARSTRHSVVVDLNTDPPDMELLKQILRAKEALGESISTRAMLLLSHMRAQPVSSAETAARLAQCSTSQARLLLSQLEQAQVLPKPKAAPSVPPLRRSTYPAADRARHVATVMDFARSQRRITRGDVIRICSLNGSKATRLLQFLVNQGQLQSVGLTKSTHYVPVD